VFQTSDITLPVTYQLQRTAVIRWNFHFYSRGLSALSMAVLQVLYKASSVKPAECW
jgi:hypothetical protein